MTLEKTLKLAGSFLKIARVFVIAIGIIVLFSILLVKGSNSIVISDTTASVILGNLKVTLNQPQLAQQMLGTNKPLLMIPACFLGGSVFCLFCDLIARTAFAPTELAISTVTAVFGAPVVLWVMATRRKVHE